MTDRPKFLYCSNGHERDVWYPFNSHLKPGMKCGELTAYDRMSGSVYCGAKLVTELEYPKLERWVVKTYLSGNVEYRRPWKFCNKGRGQVLFQRVSVNKKGKMADRESACTYKEWRDWTKGATIAILPPVTAKVA